MKGITVISDDTEVAALAVEHGAMRLIEQKLQVCNTERPGVPAYTLATVTSASDGAFYLFVAFANFANDEDNGLTAIRIDKEHNTEANREEALALALLNTETIEGAGEYSPDTSFGTYN